MSTHRSHVLSPPVLLVCSSFFLSPLLKLYIKTFSSEILRFHSLLFLRSAAASERHLNSLVLSSLVNNRKEKQQHLLKSRAARPSLLPEQSSKLLLRKQFTSPVMAATSTPQPIPLTRSLSNIDTPSNTDAYSSPNSPDVLSEPLVKFGVITDIQYADLPNRPAWYDASKTRYYRASLDHVKQAFHHWTSSDSCLFALQLGYVTCI